MSWRDWSLWALIGRGRQSDHFQYHHGVRRHLDGHAGNALLLGISRSDRGFDRDGGRRAGLRRRGGDWRLRQEHARVHDGAGSTRPPRGNSSTAATIRPGTDKRDIVSVSRPSASRAGDRLGAAAKIRGAHRHSRTRACAGMYTANTMASAIGSDGDELANSSAQDAISGQKRDDCERAGAAVVNLIRQGHHAAPDHDAPCRWKTRSLSSLHSVVSTNAVLHLLAIASSANIKCGLDDFNADRQNAFPCWPICGPADDIPRPAGFLGQRGGPLPVRQSPRSNPASSRVFISG